MLHSAINPEERKALFPRQSEEHPSVQGQQCCFALPSSQRYDPVQQCNQRFPTNHRGKNIVFLWLVQVLQESTIWEGPALRRACTNHHLGLQKVLTPMNCICLQDLKPNFAQYRWSAQSWHTLLSIPYVHEAWKVPSRNISWPRRCSLDQQGSRPSPSCSKLNYSQKQCRKAQHYCIYTMPTC